MKKIATAVVAAALAVAALGGTVVWGNGPAGAALAADDAVVWGN